MEQSIQSDDAMAQASTQQTPAIRLRWQKPLLSFLLSLTIALVSGFFLFSSSATTLASDIIDTGFDPLRSQLIAALLLTSGAALIACLFSRRLSGALLGCGLVFWFGYLQNFILVQMQPAHDPIGNLEIPDSGALLHTALVLLALGLLAAFLGGSVGKSLAVGLLDPPYRLLRSTWRRSRTSKNQKLASPLTTTRLQALPTTRFSIVLSWLGAAGLVGLFILATGAPDLFLYSPDIGLHFPPTVHGKSGNSSNGTLLTESFKSPTLGGQEREFLIYLPPSYYKPESMNRRYPTLYLLHGAPGHAKDMFTGGQAAVAADTYISQGKIPELIIISPDGNGRPGATPEWGNSFDQRQRIETYIAVDLVNYIDQHYRTLAQAADRAIGGISMGGFGAANIGIHHPNVFGQVIALGGYFQAEGGIWGHSAAYIKENSPFYTLPAIKAAWNIRFFLGDGTDDQPYISYNRKFVSELARLHIPYLFEQEANFHHSWTLWQLLIYKSLPWLQWK